MSIIIIELSYDLAEGRIIMKNTLFVKTVKCLITAGMISAVTMPVFAEEKSSVLDTQTSVESVEPRAIARNFSKTFTDSVTALGTTYTVTTIFSGSVTIGTGSQITSYDATYSGSATGSTSCSAKWKGISYTVSANHLYVEYTPGVMVGGKIYYGSAVSRTLY